MAIKVWLDAGHGGSDSGACANGLIEKDMNLITAFQTRADLEAHGVIVGMTRESDVYVSLAERCQMANNWGADFFVSEHYNAGGGDGAEDIHSIYHGKGEVLAGVLLQVIQEMTGQNLRRSYSREGSHGDYFAVIRDTSMPAVIVEPAFIDSGDAELVDTVAEQQLMGTAIAAGILRYLGIPFAPGAAPTQPTGTNTAPEGDGTILRVVVGSFTDRANATDTQEKLKGAGFDSFLAAYNKDGVDYLRVVAGSYKVRANAEEQQQKLKDAGFDSFLAAY